MAKNTSEVQTLSADQIAMLRQAQADYENSVREMQIAELNFVQARKTAQIAEQGKNNVVTLLGINGKQVNFETGEVTDAPNAE